MTSKITESTSLREVLDALVEDGFELQSSADALPVARAIRRGARAGTLLWTSEGVVVTGRSKTSGAFSSGPSALGSSNAVASAVASFSGARRSQND